MRKEKPKVTAKHVDHQSLNPNINKLKKKL